MFVFFVLSLLCLTATAQHSCGVGQTLFDSKCLQFFHVRVNFHTAEKICAASSGHLASIHSLVHNQYVANHAKRSTSGGFWIGAKGLKKEVRNALNWRWTDGSNFTYHNYQPGQPVSQGSTSCMRMYSKNGLWFTADCESLRFSFACEYPAIIQTIPSQCPSGYVWLKETDFCYRSYVQRSNFHDARRTCQNDGGDLASIRSKFENDFLVEITKHGKPSNSDWNNSVWIGLFYENSKWKWTDGTPISFANWAENEPNKMNFELWTILISDPHAFYKNSVSVWNNIGNWSQRAFVCKKAALH